jgi:NADPH:quinone reductase
MKAAFFERTGSPEVIQYGDLPPPECKANQVRIRVGAVAVNPIDTYIRNGANYWPLPKPYIIGCDFAGTVIECGSAVQRIKPSDRVWGSNQGLMGRQGTFAEEICVDEGWCYASPEKVPDTDLASVALVGITAHVGLFSRANVVAGETVFVRGGSGGVGSMVIQMSKIAGARVITTASTPEKAAKCRTLGADEVILQSDSLGEALRAAAPTGVQVFWETLRDPDFDLAVSNLAERGRMILMAGRDARPAFPVGPFYVKGCSLLGFAMFKESIDYQNKAAADIHTWLSQGKLRSQIDRVMPLSESADAHRLQEANTIQKQSILSGKLVLVP